jgi:hypothetical protein
MTSDILIGDFKPVKPSHCKWSRKIDNFCDTATVQLPAICMMKTDGGSYQKIETGMALKEGMKIEVWAGYDGKNGLRFKGFIKRRVFGVPLSLECEGYSYQLNLKKDFSFSASSVSLRKLLEKLIEGTDIKLSEDIPSVPLTNIRFKNVKGTEVLEYLKDKCLLTSHFDLDVLYCGLAYAQVKAHANFQLGWNTIKDDDLKFETDKDLAKVNIKIEQRDKKGKRKKVATPFEGKQVKTIKVRHITDEASMKAIADQKRKELLNQGYEGKINAFLVPEVSPGMSAKINDKKFPDRTGLYLIESVEGEFSKSGGRQKISIGMTLNG